MEPRSVSLPLVVITGPTASGKTSLAIELAKKFNGEIICADSRTIYQGMNVGTAKPSTEEQAMVPHWGLDIVQPGDYFSASDFKDYAYEKINEIRKRGHVPFLVGGTGLYVDSVLFDYKFGPPVDETLRLKLQHMEIGQLQQYCADNDITLPENKNNKRYLVRAIERNDSKPLVSHVPLKNSIVVGISTEKEILRSRIELRAVQIFEDGVIEEASYLGDKFGWDSEAMKSNIYPLIHKYIEGQLTIDEAKQKFITLDWRLSKRQLTWMRRNKFIHWLQVSEVEDFVANQLAIRE